MTAKNTKNIQVDEEVVASLFSLSKGFHETENDVIRRVLGLDAAVESDTSKRSDSLSPDSHESPSAILAYTQSAKFRSLGRGLDKFLCLLGWLQQAHGGEFEEIKDLPLGGRKYFAMNETEIRENARGSVSIKQIPGSSLWAMTTLSNDGKKNIIGRVLRYFSYPPSDISAVLKEFPDSDSRTSPDRLRILNSL